jgi:hypothetical protein
MNSVEAAERRWFDLDCRGEHRVVRANQMDPLKNLSRPSSDSGVLHAASSVGQQDDRHERLRGCTFEHGANAAVFDAVRAIAERAKLLQKLISRHA